MSKWSKETQEKIDETVNKICSYIDNYIKEGRLYNSNDVVEAIYNHIDNFADWLHHKTCETMIDID